MKNINLHFDNGDDKEYWTLDICLDGAPYVVCARVDTHLGVSGRNLYMKP